MTFKKFEELLKTKYPDAEACMHGKFAGTKSTGRVEIHFTPCGKCYFYYGSYQDVLAKVGIEVEYKWEIERAEEELERYKKENGRQSLFGLLDYTSDIERLERYLTDVKSGRYIIID